MVTVYQPVQRCEFYKNIIQIYADYKTDDDCKWKITDLAQSGTVDVERSTDYHQRNKV